MANKYTRQPLATQVAKAFNRLGITAQELLTGQIVHTDLVWQCAPLECEATLGGLEFRSYVDYPIKVDIDKLVLFWQEGLQLLHAHPTRAIGSIGWRGAAAALPGVPEGERNSRLSIPEGFPDRIVQHAGAVFSMEVAKILETSAPIVRAVKTEDDYFVDLHSGARVGVEGGLPTTDSPWDIAMTGQVALLASIGRGRATSTCRYDLLSKVRSVLHERAGLFTEFDGLDWALQVLGVQYQDRLCSELQRAVENMPTEHLLARRRVEALEEAIKLMDAWSMNDRVKILSIFETLVPEVMTASSFQRHIFNTYTTIPAVLSAATERKIKNYLRNRKAFFEKDL